MALIPFIAVFFASLSVFLYCRKGKAADVIVISIICLLGIMESVIGIKQLFGFALSNNAFFPLTGTFNNPGPLGCLLAVTVAVAGSATYDYQERMKYSLTGFASIPFFFLFMTCAFCAVMLPSTLSRGAIVALSVAVCIFMLRETRCVQWLCQHKMAAACIAVAIIALCVGLFFLKKDSAIGRLHIWNMECRAILNHPLGTGSGSFEGTYGAVQEEFFRSRNRPAAIVRVAGCPDHSFNEYLGIGVEFGIPAMLLAIGIVAGCICVLLVKRSPLAYGLIVLAVFAFFSYPLDVPLLAGIFSVFLGAATAEIFKMTQKRWTLAISVVLLAASVYALAVIHVPKEREREIAEASWRRAKYWSDTKRYDLAIEEFSLSKDILLNNKRFLYDYGYALYLAHRNEESLKVLERGALVSNDPMFHNIMGRNYEALGYMNRAEEEYWIAHYMVPCRLYPLQRLILLYLSQGRYEDAAFIRKKALAMPVNASNKLMAELHMEIQEIVF